MPRHLSQEAIKIALNALFEELTDRQKAKVEERIMFSVRKHGLEGEDETAAVEALRGY